MVTKRRTTLVIKGDSTADFICSCGAAHTLSVDPRMLRSSTPVRVRFRCSCGLPHAVFLERRAAVRKQVELPGLCTIPGNGVQRTVLVRNLSRTGALLELPEEAGVRVGDRLVLEFELEHAETTRFSKPAKVRRVVGREIGAEFVPADYDRVYDMALALCRPAAPAPR
jgi:hypothetical protein